MWGKRKQRCEGKLKRKLGGERERYTEMGTNDALLESDTEDIQNTKNRILKR